MKQLLNSVLAGYEELLRPRFVLNTTSALIIPHILGYSTSFNNCFIVHPNKKSEEECFASSVGYFSNKKDTIQKRHYI